MKIAAIPVAQPRVRATTRGGHAAVYNPESIKNPVTGERKPHPIVLFKATLKHFASRHFKGAPMRGPLRIDCTFVFPRPKGMMWKKKPMPRERHVGKPDRDNVDKAVLDALKGIVFADDNQVCDGRIQKWYAAGDEQAHVELVISELDQ